MDARPSRRHLLGAGAALLLPAVAACARPEPVPTAAATAGDPARMVASAPVPTATPSATPRTGIRVSALTEVVEEYLEGRSGRVGVAVHDRRTGTRMSVGSYTGETLSTVKVPTLLALLREAEEERRELTPEEERLAKAMIQRSDNTATDVLLARLGDEAVDEVADELGMAHTDIHSGDEGWWGYSLSTPEDLLALMDALVDGAAAGSSSTAYALDLMEGVVWEQRWGVAAPPIEGEVTVRTKNGWGPMADGYRMNSVGHVLGDGRDYTMALISRSPQGFSVGKATLNGVVRRVHEALAKPLVAG